MTYDKEKSDKPMVPTKSSNKSNPTDAERMEGRGLTKGNSPALFHHFTVERVREAFEAAAKDAAPGIDGVVCRT